jgi:hypothetical protein
LHELLSTSLYNINVITHLLLFFYWIGMIVGAMIIYLFSYNIYNATCNCLDNIKYISYKTITCYRCGKKGHTSCFCKINTKLLQKVIYIYIYILLLMLPGCLKGVCVFGFDKK